MFQDDLMLQPGVVEPFALVKRILVCSEFYSKYVNNKFRWANPEFKNVGWQGLTVECSC